MTERALLVRHATTPDGRFAAIGIEHAAVRVFETSTGSLVAECAVRGHRELLLASTALGFVSEQASAPFVALGTTCGRVIIHDCAKDATVANIVLHDAATPIVGMSFHGPNLVALSSTGRVSVIRAATGTVVGSKLRSVGRASALSVAAASGDAATSSTITVAVASSGPCGVFSLAAGGSSAEATLDEVCTFTGHISAPEYCRIIGNGTACLTATYGDGTLRLWDIRPSQVARGAADDRCRAHLPCDHRLVAVDVIEQMVPANDGTGTQVLRADVFATTVTGEVLHFRFVAQRLVSAAATAAAPIKPIGRLASMAANGRVLLAKPMPPTVTGAASSNKNTAADVAMLAIRGRWGTPTFDRVAADLIVEAIARTRRAATSTAAKAPSAVTKLPFMDEAHATAASDHIVLNAKKLKRRPMVGGATVVDGNVAADRSAVIPLAQSIEDLPVSAGGGKVLTLAAAEAALLKRMEGGDDAPDAAPVADDDDDADLDAAVKEDAAALGAEGGSGVVVLLHQALHAKDASMVTELVMLAARSHADMVATVRGLRIAYLAQLMKILADRVATASAASPLHGWVHVVLRERGPEIQRCIAAADALEASTEAAVGRAFKAILAPILAQYRRLSALRDSVSVLHGRSSVFLSTRAAGAKAAFRNNFREPNTPFGVHPTRVVLPGATDGADESSSDEAKPKKKTRRGGAAKRAAKREALLMDDGSSDDADDDDAVITGRHKMSRGLDDALDSDDEGDDGSEAFGDEDSGDGDEEGAEDLDEDEEMDEEDDDDESLDDEDLNAIGSVATDEDDDAADDVSDDLAPSDDVGGSGEEDEEEGSEVGDDGSVDYESGDGEASGEDEVADINQAHTSRRSGQLVVDADEGAEPDHE